MKAKSRPSPDAYAIFQSALRAVLKVSKADMNQMLAEEKIANEGKPKRGPKPRHSSASTSDHASENSDSD